MQQSASTKRRSSLIKSFRKPQENEIYVSLLLELVSISDVDGHGQLNFRMLVTHPDIEEEFGYEDLKKYQLHHDIPFFPNNSFLCNGKNCEWDHDECEFKVHGGVLSGLIDFHAVFEDSIDLHYFPFDRQSMNISIKFTAFEREKDLKVYFYDYKVKVHIASAVLLNEWRIEPTIEHYGIERHKRYGGPTSLEVRFRVERVPTFYISQVVRPLFLIVCLGSVASTFEVGDAADRLSVILTLLLTAVAFKYMVAEYLPRVPYVTLLDNYVTTSFSMLFISAIEIGVTKLLLNIGAKTEVITALDLWFWIILYVPFVAIHALWFYYGCSDAIFRPSWDEVERNDDLADYSVHNAKSKIVSAEEYEIVGDMVHASAKAVKDIEDKKKI